MSLAVHLPHPFIRRQIMSVAQPEAPTGEQATNSSVGPGETKLFVYVGEMIPFQVYVQNQSASDQANFTMQGADSGGSEWKLFQVLDPGQTISYEVEWPSRALFWNQGLVPSSILVYGFGIFPEDPKSQGS
jgi:hypothetical protein